MDIKIRPIVPGASGAITTTQGRHEFSYEIYDNDNEASVFQLRDAMLSFLPPVIDTECGLEDLKWDETDKQNRYVFTASYSTRQRESVLRISWDSTGGTVRMTGSRGTQSYARPSVTAPDFQGAIAVRNGEPEGVDVVIPALKLTFTYRWPRNVVNLAYVKAMAGLVGSTNNNTFYTFAPGELLFLGTSGEIDPSVPTEIQYHFAASANVTGLSIGQIANIAKQGHQFLWVLFDQQISSNRVVQRPLAAYVETVYQQANFSAFGIGA